MAAFDVIDNQFQLVRLKTHLIQRKGFPFIIKFLSFRTPGEILFLFADQEARFLATLEMTVSLKFFSASLCLRAKSALFPTLQTPPVQFQAVALDAKTVLIGN